MVLIKILITLIMLSSIIVCIKRNQENMLTITSFLLLSVTIIYYIPIVCNRYDWCTDIYFLFVILTGFCGMFIAVILYEYYLKKEDYHVQVCIGRFQLLSNEYENVFLENKGIIMLLTIMVLLYYVMNLLIMFQNYSWNIVSLLLRDRIDQYSSASTGFESFEGVVRPLALILCAYYFSNGKKMGLAIWFAILTFILVFLHGRFEVILHFLILLLYYNNHVKKIRVSTILVLLIVSVAFLSIANYARTGLYVSGTINFDALIPQNVLNQLFRATSDTTITFYDIYSKKLPCDWFKQYYFYLPISIIPRTIWSGKPIVSYFWRLTKIVYGVYPYENNSRIPVLTSTIWGEAYHEGGIINVFLVNIIYVWFLSLLIKILKKYKYADLLVYSLIIAIPMDMRGGLYSTIMSWVFTVIMILFMRLIGLYKKRYFYGDNSK